MVKAANGKRTIEAVKLPAGRASHVADGFTYQVLPSSSAEARRGSERRRLRFQTGKLVDDSGRFLSECIVYDRSSRGLRLSLQRDVAVPSSFSLYLDKDGEILSLQTVWRRETMMGAALAGPHEIAPSQRRSLGAPLYAFKD